MKKTAAATIPRRPKIRRRTDIDEAKIVITAAKQIEEHGLHHFSMHRLAAELNVTATTIYYYFKNKREVLIATASYILQLLPLDQKGTPWETRLKDFVMGNNALLLRYPGLALFLIKNRDTEPGSIWKDRVSEILIDGGFSHEDAVAAFSILVFLINPVTFLDERIEDSDQTRVSPQPFLGAASGHPERYPALQQLGPDFLDIPYNTLFEQAVERVIAGIAAELKSSSPVRKHSRTRTARP